MSNCVNPFYHRIKLKKSDWPSIIIGSILLAPIRIIIIITLFLIASLISKLCNHWLSHIDRYNDPDQYHEWRIRFKNFVKHIFRSILFISGFYYVNIKQIGDIEKENDVPIYVMAPHTSLFDILAGVVLNVPSSVAKADIVDIPLFGNIFKLSDPVLVERDSPNSRQDVFKKVSDVIKYSKIVFFPEGTCSNHRGLLQFKNGAFKFGYPIIPIALRFNQFNGPDTLSWTWDGPSTIWSLWLTLCRWRTDLELTKLPVYYPTDEERKNPDLYALNVTKVLVNELNLPCLFYSYDDAKYFKYRSFRSSTCVKFMKLIDKIRKIKWQTKNISNGNNDKLKNETSTMIISYNDFLCEFIDKIFENINTNDNLNDKLNQQKLLQLMEITDLPDINQSNSIKELMICLNRLNNDDDDIAKIYHLKAVCNLVDLREKDLWKRLENAYNTFINQDNESITLKQLEMLLWIALGINNNDISDDLSILSFDDFRNLLINNYQYALEENMPI